MARIKHPRACKQAPPRNYKIDVKRLAEIRRLQKSEKCHTSKAAIERVARETMLMFKPGMRLRQETVEALQVASEDYLHKLFQQADVVAAHAGRITITPGDLDLVKKLDEIRGA